MLSCGSRNGRQPFCNQAAVRTSKYPCILLNDSHRYCTRRLLTTAFPTRGKRHHPPYELSPIQFFHLSIIATSIQRRKWHTIAWPHLHPAVLFGNTKEWQQRSCCTGLLSQSSSKRRICVVMLVQCCWVGLFVIDYLLYVATAGGSGVSFLAASQDTRVMLWQLSYYLAQV